MLNLSDVTFLIPYRRDSEDRERNLRIVVSYLLDHFRTNIVIAEHDEQSQLEPIWPEAWRGSVEHLFIGTEAWYFHRARCINAAAKVAKTPFVVMQDTDALVDVAQYQEAVERLRSRAYEVCFPYAHRVMWVPNEFVPEVERVGSVEPLEGADFPVSGASHTIVSLVVFLDRTAFVASGMLNEHFKSWGYEDVEFFERIHKLGLGVMNLEGLVYHLDHERGENWGDNPLFERNRQEYEKVLMMDRGELRRYIQTWPWVRD